MKRFFPGFPTAVTIPAVLVVAVLLAMPEVRHATYRLAVELPGIGAYFIIRHQAQFEESSGKCRVIGLKPFPTCLFST